MSKIYTFEELPPDVFCSLCKLVLKSPVACVSCMFNFCAFCAENQAKKSPFCPNCAKVWTMESLKDNVYFVEHYYNKIIVRCSQKSCPWIGNLGELWQHQLECEDQIMKDVLGGQDSCLESTNEADLEHQMTCPFYESFKRYLKRYEDQFRQLIQEKKELSVLKQLSCAEIINLKEQNSKLKKENELLRKKRESEGISQISKSINSNPQRQRWIRNRRFNKSKESITTYSSEESIDFDLAKYFEKYPNVLQNLSIESLRADGFRIGFIKPYKFHNRFDEFEKFKRKKLVILAGRQTGCDILLLAAMGTGKNVFRETYKKNECHLHNGVYWYFMKNHSIGFSSDPNINLGFADITEGKLKLSWNVYGTLGGYRLGEEKGLVYSREFEKVLLYKN